MEAGDRTEPIEPWHRQIKKNDVGPDLGSLFDRFDPIRCFGHHKDPIVGCERLPKQCSEVGYVVDE